MCVCVERVSREFRAFFVDVLNVDMVTSRESVSDACSVFLDTFNESFGEFSSFC